MSVNDYDHDLYEAIEELVAEGELEDGMPALGVARQVIDLGYSSLTAKQKHVYDTYVVPLLAARGERREIMARTYNAPD